MVMNTDGFKPATVSPPPAAVAAFSPPPVGEDDAVGAFPSSFGAPLVRPSPAAAGSVTGTDAFSVSVSVEASVELVVDFSAAVALVDEASVTNAVAASISASVSFVVAVAAAVAAVFTDPLVGLLPLKPLLPTTNSAAGVAEASPAPTPPAW